MELQRSSARVARSGPRSGMRAAALVTIANGLVFLLSARLVAAAEADVRAALVWDVGPHKWECITKERLQRDVETNLARSVFDASGAAELVVRITIRRTERPWGWLATIRAEDARGRLWGVRELRSEAASCHALDDKLVVVTALMVDPALMESPPGEEEWPEQAQPLVAQQESPESVLELPPPSPRRRRVPRRWELEIDAGAASALGVLPKTAWGTALGLELRFPWFGAVRLGASAFAGQTVAMQPSGQTRFRSAAAGGFLCPVASQWGAARASVCAGIDALGTWAESWEIPDPRTERRVTLRSALNFRAAGVIGKRWLLGGGADLEMPWRRDTFVYGAPGAQREILFRPAPFAVLVVAGAGVVFR